MDNLVTSPDSCKLCRHDVIDKKEVISKLPDSLLHHILSFLSTIDAIRTSVLARRWKFLWTYLSDFNIEVMLSSSQKNETQKQMINYLFNQVDTILEKAKFIKKFRFVAYGIPVDVDQANSWIFALLKHKIQELELSLYLRSSFPLANTLPVPTSLSMMNLEFGCVLKVPTCIHFPSLKTLTLQYITFIDKTSAQQLFSSCPVLQKLTLCSCDWKNVRNVSIKIPTLTTLIIEDDFSRDDLLNCKVTIDAINLVSLSCTNYLSIEFILINLTTLAYAYIDVSNGCSSLAQYTISRAVELLSGICHVKSLVLSKDTLEILSRAENLLMRLPTFHNLIHFSVDQGMYDFTGGALMDILEKFPNLEVLDIVDGFDPDFCLDGEAWTLSTVPHCLKSSLKLVSVWNFFGEVAEMQLLGFLLKHATKLRRIKMFFVGCLSADLKKQADISNQLQVMRKGLASCAVELR